MYLSGRRFISSPALYLMSMRNRFLIERGIWSSLVASHFTGEDIVLDWADDLEDRRGITIQPEMQQQIASYADAKYKRALDYFSRRYPDDNFEDIEDIAVEAVMNLIDRKFLRAVVRSAHSSRNVQEIAGDFSMSGLRRMESPGNLQKGGAVSGSRSDILSDAESAAQTPEAVAVYLENADSDVLSVTRNIKTRGPNPNDVNMPGGVVDPGEDPENAAARELFEETGIVAHSLVPVYTGTSEGHTVTTYRVTKWSGQPHSSWEGDVSWRPVEDLLRSTFGEYFKNVLKSIGKL